MIVVDDDDDDEKEVEKWLSLFRCLCRLRRSIHQSTLSSFAQPVPIVIGVHNGPFLVVDLFRFLITNQQQNGADQEDGRSPAHAVRPAKVPVRPIGGHCIGVMQFRVEEGGEECQRNNDGQHWSKKETEPVRKPFPWAQA